MKSLLKSEIQAYLKENLHANSSKLILQKPIFKDIDNKLLSQQIIARKKAEKKLPLWFNTENILYHQGINIEQTSSETCAKFKAEFFKNAKRSIDLTAGFGVDSYYFSKQSEKHTYCEINDNLAEIVAHNYQQLNAQNIEVIKGNGLEYLAKSKEHFDWIYLDPARRNASVKVFKMVDCLPNVIDHLDLLKSKSDHVLIKASPLYDLKTAYQELKHIKAIYCIALKNEVKELLIHLDFSIAENQDIIHCINLPQEKAFSFSMAEEKSTISSYSPPLDYIYIPNTAILKSGAFKHLGASFGLSKLGKNTHLYTHSQKLENFPGRVFKVLKEGKLNKAFLKEYYPEGKANIIIKNYPIDIKTLKKKTKLIEGGERYLLACSSENKKHVLAMRLV